MAQIIPTEGLAHANGISLPTTCVGAARYLLLQRARWICLLHLLPAMEELMVRRKPDDKAQMNLRLRGELRKKIAVEAKKHGRSLNGELVHRLERSFDREAVEFMADQIARVDKILKLMAFG